MMPRTSRWLPFLGALLMLALGSTAACGGASTPNGRIVVLPIDGNKSANNAVKDIVSGRYQLVSAKEYDRKARDLDAEELDSSDVRKVSRKLQIDAMVTGEFRKRGKKRYELRLSFREGSTGREFDALTIKFKSKKLSERDLRKIESKLYSTLRDVNDWARENNRRGKRVSDRRAEKARDEARRERRSRNRDDDDRRLAKSDRKKKKKKKRRKKRRDYDDDYDDDDYDDDDYDDDRRKKKKKKKKIPYEETARDKSGQAIDDEDPF